MKRICAWIVFMATAVSLWAAPTKPLELTFTSQGKTVHVDVMAPAAEGFHPAVIILHGASGVGPREAFLVTAQFFAEHGYVAFFPHYFDVTDSQVMGELNPERIRKWEQAIDDCVRFAMQQKNIDPKKISAVSFSLGSFLVIDLAPDQPHIRAIAEFYGGLTEQAPATLGTYPPILILHGKKDTVVPVTKAHELEQVLQQRQVPYDVHIYPNEEHGFSPAAQHDAEERALKFFHQHVY